MGGIAKSKVPQKVGPLLRWAGSKRRSVHKYLRFFPPTYTQYVEPFAGSAAIFFDIKPERAVLSDINEPLIATYRAVRDAPNDVFESYRKFGDSEEEYYSIRKAFNSMKASEKRAAMFLHLNRLCFNGIYRTNSCGDFNVPFGGRKPVPRLTRERLVASAALLKRASLLRQDFRKTIERAAVPGAFFFIDPPYFTASRRIFREYGPKHFSERDFADLADLLTLIDERGGTFLLSYAAVREARALSRRWSQRTVRVMRHVAGFAGDRRSVNELLAMNYEM